MVENAYLYKPVLNKIMTTLEKYMKYNSAAPLIKEIRTKIFRLSSCMHIPKHVKY